MGRQMVVRTLVAGALLTVVSVLGLAVKIGRDTSQYLQTISSQREWQSVGVNATDVVSAGGGASIGLHDGEASVGQQESAL